MKVVVHQCRLVSNVSSFCIVFECINADLFHDLSLVILCQYTGDVNVHMFLLLNHQHFCFISISCFLVIFDRNPPSITWVYLSIHISFFVMIDIFQTFIKDASFVEKRGDVAMYPSPVFMLSIDRPPRSTILTKGLVGQQLVDVG